MRIDRSSAIPLYHQFKMYIIEMIKNKNFNPGQRIPSETSLCTQFGLSRYPIRQALAELVQEGWLLRLRGKGTFVSTPRVQLSVTWQLLGFNEDMERKGHKVETRILENRIDGSRTDVAENLQIQEQTPVVCISRLRLLDGYPYLVDYIYVRSDLCPGLENLDLNNVSLFGTFRKYYGLTIARAHRTLTIESASASIAKMLLLKNGSPLFKLTDVCYSNTNVPVQFASVLINSERSEFVFDLSLERSISPLKVVLMDQPTNPQLKTK
jgi:GntR family transcriptional regulator